MGNGNTRKLDILQKCTLRIINNKGYRSHIDLIFKSEQMLKILDVSKLHVYKLHVYKLHVCKLHVCKLHV